MSKKVTTAQIEGALRRWAGIKSLAARDLNITRQAIHRRVNESAHLQTVLTEIDEENLDIGESHILKGLRAGDRHYVMYFMNRKGKERGYGPKVEAKLSDSEIEAIVATFGGDLEKLRAVRDALE